MGVVRKGTISEALGAYLDASKQSTVVLSALEKHMLSRPPDTSRNHRVLHPSEVASDDWCPRYNQMVIEDRIPVKAEVLRLRTRSIFAYGHLAHQKWQQWLADADMLWGQWRSTNHQDILQWVWGKNPGPGYRYAEVPLNIDLWGGHADGIVLTEKKGPMLLEIKGLSVDTPLPTPTGWTTMGAVQVGDELIGSDGRPCRVTAKSERKSIGSYIVRFDDGSSVVCDPEHYWWTFAGSNGGREAVVSVEDMAASLDRKHRVPLAAPLDLADADLVVDPYLLGVWLGDGTYRNGSAFIATQTEVMDRLRVRGVVMGVDKRPDEQYEERSIHGLVTGLRLLGLSDGKTHVLSPQRYIPQEYLRGSYQQRLDLLRGLMDTDGTAVKVRKSVQFTTTSKQLAEDVRELVLSLGQRPYLIPVERNGFGKTVTSYDVRWTPVSVSPFSVPRKDVIPLRAPMTTKGTRRMVVSVERGPDTAVTQCVSVDSPNRTYLCGDAMIPTHNTIGTGTIRYGAPHLLGEGDLDKMFSAITQPFASHMRQVQIYLELLDRMGRLTRTDNPYLRAVHPVDKAVFLYECKSNQDTREFIVERDTSWVQDRMDAADELSGYLHSGDLIPCPHDGRCKCGGNDD